MRNLVLSAVVLAVAAAGTAFLLVKQRADSDTANITTLEERKLSQDQLGDLVKGGNADLRTVMKAAEQAKDMKQGIPLDLWRAQMGSDQAAVRLKAVQELAVLARVQGGCPECVGLLRDAAARDPDEDVRMLASMSLEELSAATDGAGGSAAPAATDAPAPPAPPAPSVPGAVR
jgi:hypothetical protein